jgi:hypothetical protein
MEPRSWKPLAVSAGLFGVILAAAVMLFVLGGRWTQRVLFFPAVSSAKLTGEARFLPRRNTVEGRLRQLAEEAVLGPATPTLRRYLPRGLEIQSVVVRQGVAYLSVSRHLLQGTEDYHGTAEDALQALADTILYNVHRVRRLYLLVDGQLPRGQGQEGFGFRRKVLR